MHQLGSASATPGGKFLLVGPTWSGEKPSGFIDVLRVATNVAGVFPPSFAARSDESKARAVLDQIGMYPVNEDQPGQRSFGYEAHAANAVYPPGVTAEMIAANADVSRPPMGERRNVLDRSGQDARFQPADERAGYADG